MESICPIYGCGVNYTELLARGILILLGLIFASVIAVELVVWIIWCFKNRKKRILNYFSTKLFRLVFIISFVLAIAVIIILIIISSSQYSHILT